MKFQRMVNFYIPPKFVKKISEIFDEYFFVRIFIMFSYNVCRWFEAVSGFIEGD